MLSRLLGTLCGLFIVCAFCGSFLSKTTMGSKQSLRFVIVSDTHRIYRQEIPPGDVLIHCGDSEWSVSEMELWARKKTHRHVLAVCGNMDWRLENEKDKLERVIYLQDNEVEISGLKIYGSPWTPEFTGVFQLYGDEEANATWAKLPSNLDVLITHGPPHGIRDITSRGKRVGDDALLRKVLEIKPRLHCFGHIHESYGTHQTEDTLFCNAAVFNNHRPVVVDVPIDKSLPATIV